jgi:translation initiation factor IF-2
MLHGLCHIAGVTINTYKVIYNLIDDVKAAMEGKLRTIEERQPLGSATVRFSGLIKFD